MTLYERKGKHMFNTCGLHDPLSIQIEYLHLPFFRSLSCCVPGTRFLD